MDILTPPKLPLHHSLADWALGGDYLIDPTHFVSPPTSLSFQDGTSCHATLAPPLGMDVPYGRLAFSLYCVPATPWMYPRTSIGFRLRASQDLVLGTNYYYLIIWHDAEWPPGGPRLLLYRYTTTDIILGAWYFDPPLDAWTDFRILWLPGCTYYATPTFQITIQYWTGTTWATIGTAIDLTNSWADRGDNSIGFYLQDDQHWTDNALLHEFI